jgi:hypothetical protein
MEQAGDGEYDPAHPYRQGEDRQPGEQGQEDEKFEHGVSP